MDLIAILQKMGAIITVQTDRVITIEGVDRLGGFDHRPIPDRIEAARWACAALATGGDIFVRGAQQLPMMTVPQRLPADRRRASTSTTRASGSGTRAASCAPSPSRPTCTRAS